MPVDAILFQLRKMDEGYSEAYASEVIHGMYPVRWYDDTRYMHDDRRRVMCEAAVYKLMELMDKYGQYTETHEMVIM